MSHRDEVDKILQTGAMKAEKVAKEVLARVRKAIGTDR